MQTQHTALKRIQRGSETWPCGTMTLIRRFGRTEQRLAAEVGRLQATVATQQKDKLDLSLRLEERSKELASTCTRLSEEKARCAKLALEVESGERAIWRMASQLEVGTHSVLSQWSQTGVVAGLQKRLEGMQQKVNDADAQVDKYRKKAAEEQEKARVGEGARALRTSARSAGGNSQNGEEVAAAHGRVARQIRSRDGKAAEVAAGRRARA